MLDPQERELLLDALRPAAGATLEAAVGTSFSVDLESLLMAPLTFASLDMDSARPDPMALLAALRQNAERIALYCDAAAIRAPGRDQKLMVLLESTLLPVRAPRGGAFHPKFWALRFRHSDGAREHRLLILSRNLTFDSSWDLIVRFDEDADGQLPGREAAAVVRRLDALSPSRLARSLVSSLSTVRFAVPAPFDTGTLHPIGLSTDQVVDPLDGASGDRILVLSPFLAAQRLETLAELATRNRTLVSRPDALSRLGGAALAAWSHPLILRDVEPDADQADEHVRGLHAKLIVLDNGDRSRWFAGSANATVSAVERNAEVVVELSGSRRAIGVGVLLSQSDREVRFRDLLREMPGLDPEPLAATPEELEDRRLEQVARALATAKIEATVEERAEGFDVRLTIDGAAELDARDRVFARLVTRTLEVELQRAAMLSGTLHAALPSEITSLVELRVTGDPEIGRERRFIVKARLSGDPADRIDQLLVDLIPDQRRFALLLLLMLAAGDDDPETGADVRRWLGGEALPTNDEGELQMPLFESLVRASAGEPKRLAAIDKLVTSLQATEAGRTRLPDGFESLWAAFRPLIRAR